ncbi:MAG: hypothetical protein HZC54_25230 [Verrucomicrobia bacterium]|nr:hypothetical protein [Verrucomicrobiota bacterium]
MNGELTWYEPRPDTLYSLEVITDLTGASRRSILIYCRQGFIQPILLPPFGVMAFDERAIRTIREIERLRAEFDINLAGIRIIYSLLDEIRRLHRELAGL